MGAFLTARRVGAFNLMFFKGKLQPEGITRDRGVHSNLH